MTPKQPAGVGRLLRFLALAVVVTTVMIGIGYFPTKRWGGSEAVAAMLAGCAISLAASVVGSFPIIAACRGPAVLLAQAALLSTALRLMVVLVLALSAALSDWFDRVPLLVWVAISYLFLLIADTVYAVHFVGAADRSEK